MLERLIFKNHVNEEISVGSTSGIFANYSDLHDYAWSHNVKGDRISGFKKGVVKKTIPIIIQCNTEEDGIKARNQLYEIAEKDIIANIPGMLIVGDYYMKCFISCSKKSEYLESKRHMKASLTIVTDSPMWVKETTISFRNNTGSTAEGNNLDYENDFPYDYSSNLVGRTLFNSNFLPCNFRMTIFGDCTNPEVMIAGHLYKVNASLEAAEYMVIDSVEKTIYKVTEDGTRVNLFNDRERSSYIFEKIPVGNNGVSVSTFDFDITLLEERSEPLWI